MLAPSVTAGRRLPSRGVLAPDPGMVVPHQLPRQHRPGDPGLPAAARWRGLEGAGPGSDAVSDLRLDPPRVRLAGRQAPRQLQCLAGLWPP